MQALSRADLIRGNWGRRRQAQLYPPGALPDTQLENRCTRCGDCARACPEGIITAGQGGFPVLDMKRGGCSFCGQCQAACPSGALSRQAAHSLPWQAVIAKNCLAAQQIECRVCGESCDADAIRFELAIGQAPRPLLALEACTGCGECVRACPAAAITLAPTPHKDKQP
ncbi:ferredoxin-type protein NapF [Craterilacuibacter sinensis]|uniref:Ferredoxin-type protein NapF n=1 Tax=Craterilacuibacter sinensis TaxID=2686017 RepID=A0A845BXP4_9NEIS|nr:ferredoxin-type protein NapF [Craterilacuibacter sinensis]MXR37273.1 ferredoxin-type protein NapF [Craterilacuibacter sinensis]